MMRPRPRGPLPPARGTSRPRRKRDLANKIPYPSFKGKGFWFTYSGPIVVLFIFAVSYWANKVCCLIAYAHLHLPSAPGANADDL